MMTYNVVSNERKKKFAEVFTPLGVVFEMILQDGIRESLMDVDKTIFDPAVGQGQFPCAELVWKLFYQIGRLDEDVALRALKSLYGMDIQEASAQMTREHLIATLFDSYAFFTGKEFTRTGEAVAIVEENIMVGDTLKYFAAQQSLF